MSDTAPIRKGWLQALLDWLDELFRQQRAERPKIVLTPANLNALLHGYPVVTNEAVIVLDRPVRR